MEAARSESRGAPAAKAPPRRKKVEEHHHRTDLVGRIVEKGFSSDPNPRPPLSSSQPSALPFPVARHRSHGPHWAPVGTVAGGEEEVHDDRDETDYDPIAPFAKPPKKKERKGLDFSRWRELVDDGSSSKEVRLDVGKVKSKVKRVSDGVSRDRKALAVEEEDEEFGVSRGGDNMGSYHAVDRVNGLGAPLGEEEKGEIGISEGGGFDSSLVVSGGNVDAKTEVVEVATPSIADEIDVENCARLGQMSRDEIADAQAEIMDRMSPAVLEMLRKRGRDKMDVKRSASSSGKEKMKKEIQNGSGKASNGELKGPKQAKENQVSRMGGSVLGINELQPSGVHDSSAWKAWSGRVEKVRGSRFSLDGNVIASSNSEEQKNECCQYNPENVTERDYLRTEGDPGAAGYTIKEAVSLVRSMVPAQRSFALHLLASVLDKAISNLQKQDVRYSVEDMGASNDLVDWQAVWAYALGPEPEIALALRIALDDNHNSVVLACTKVIQCLLCCDLNEKFFNISETSSYHENASCTAPVFRSRPEIDCGFLHGGFWKYNTKPSHILPTCYNDEEDEDKNEEKHTIQDDVVVAGQDFAAGLVRMGVLPRICYLLETDPSPPLDECLVSILIGLARHSPTCSNAIMKCPRLVQTVVDRFTKLTSLENLPYQIKSVLLLKVLSEVNKGNCLDFINHGMFQRTMWQLYRNALSLNDFIHFGKEQCKLTSALMVQQLRLWKVCIRYGYCISYFADFFPAMCFWLSPPTFGTLINNDVLGEFTSVTTEAFLVLAALSRRLPSVHTVEQVDKCGSSDNGKESWSWSPVIPMVELAMKWLLLQNIPNLTSLGSQKRSDTIDEEYTPGFHLLWVISAVLHMLSTIIDRIAPEKASDMHNCGTLPWLPDFVSKIGLEIVKSGFLNFIDSSCRSIGGHCPVDSSLVECLCQLRQRDNRETSLASTCCLHGLVELIISIDRSIQRAKGSNSHQPLERYNSSLEDKILSDGIIKSGQDDLVNALNIFVSLVGSRWQIVQSIEMFGRGGPAPGLGLGWGSSGGGIWAVTVLQSQLDAWLLQSLYKAFPIVPDKDISFAVAAACVSDWPMDRVFPILQKINSVIGMCLVAGPSNRSSMEFFLNILFQGPVLRFLDICIHHFLHSNERLKPFNWKFSVEDCLLFSKALDAHFLSRWLTAKKKSPDKTDGSNPEERSFEKNGNLEIIHEDVEMLETTDVCQEETSLQIEWAYQRLPLPIHWFLSPLCTVSDSEAAQALHGSSNVKSKGSYSSSDPTEVVQGGLFFLLGLEAISYFLFVKSIFSPIIGMPLVWKLHALSMMLVIKPDVLDDVRFRDIFETLQTLYGWHLQQPILKDVKPNGEPLPSSHKCLDASTRSIQALDFQKQVHESYNTFIETFVEHFASISYGNVTFGRQVAVYLHRSVDIAVRLAAWNTLSNAHVLELLPPLGNCISEASGYLEPIEDNEVILEAYVKSWTSGALDRAAVRGSMSFAIALHHLSHFIFHENAPDKLLLRNRLVKSFLRGLSRKPTQEGMMLDLIKHEGPPNHGYNAKENLFTSKGESRRRFTILSEACEGNSSLLAELEKVKPSVTL